MGDKDYTFGIEIDVTGSYGNIEDAVNELQRWIDGNEKLRLKLKVDLNLSADAIKGLEKLAKQVDQIEQTQKKAREASRTAISRADQNEVYEKMRLSIRKLGQELEQNNGRLISWSTNTISKTGEITGATIKYADSLGRVKTELYKVEKSYEKIRDENDKIVKDKKGNPKERLAEINLIPTTTKYSQNIDKEQSIYFERAKKEIKEISEWQKLIDLVDASDVQTLDQINKKIDEHKETLKNIKETKIAITAKDYTTALNNQHIVELTELENKLQDDILKKKIKSNAEDAKASAKKSAKNTQTQSQTQVPPVKQIQITKDFLNAQKGDFYTTFEKRIDNITESLKDEGSTLSKIFASVDEETGAITRATVDYTDKLGKACTKVYQLKEYYDEIKDAQGNIVNKKLTNIDLVPVRTDYTNNVGTQQSANYDKIVKSLNRIYGLEEKVYKLGQNDSLLDKTEIDYKEKLLRQISEERQIINEILNTKIMISEIEKVSVLNAEQQNKIAELNLLNTKKMELIKAQPSYVSTTRSGTSKWGEEFQQNLPEHYSITVDPKKLSDKHLKAYAQAVAGLGAEYGNVTPKVDKFGNSFLEMEVRAKRSGDKWQTYTARIVEGIRDINGISTGMDNTLGKIYAIDKGIKDVSNRQLSIFEKFKTAMQVYPVWMAATTIFMQGIYQIRDAVSFINELDKSMTNIAMITGKTREEIAGMTQEYVKLSETLHDTISNVTQASEEFLRAGHSQEDTLKLIESSTIMSKIAGQDQKQTADQLIAMTNAYGISADKTMRIVDKLTTVDNASATSTAELGTALERTSASAQMAGVSFDQIVSYIGIVSSVTRKSASSIGESFKTIFARMQDINQRKKLDEYGEDISNVEKSLRQVGVHLRDSKDSFKPMNEVLDEVAMKWKTLTDVQKADVAKSIAGVRQRENFVVLMEHYNEVLGLQSKMTGSAGSAMERYEIYAESTGAKINDLTIALQKLYMKLFNSKSINTAISGLVGLIKIIDNLISSLGTLGTVLTFVVPLISVKLLSSLYSISAGAKLTETVVAGLSLGFQSLGTKIASLISNPITWLITAIGLAVAGFVYYKNKQEEVRKKTEEVTQAQKKFAESIDDVHNSVMNASLDKASSDLEDYKKSLDFDENVKKIDELKQRIENIRNAVSVPWEMKESNIKMYEEQIASLEAENQKYYDGQKKLDAEIEVYSAKMASAKKAVAEYNATGKFSKQTMDEILKNYPRLTGYIGKEEKLREQLISIIASEAEVAKKACVVKLENDEKFYKYKVTANAELINELNDFYGVDFTHYKTLAQAKLAVDIELLNKLKSKWSQFYNVQGKLAFSMKGAYTFDAQGNFDPRLPMFLAEYMQSVADANARLNSLTYDFDPITADFNSIPDPDTEKKGKEGKEGKEADSGLSDYYESLIRATRANAELSAEKEKTIQADIELAKTSKNVALQLEKQNELLITQKLHISQLQASTKELKWEFAHQADISGFNTTSWLDEKGEATIEFNRQYLASSAEVQQTMKKTFDILQRLKKAWIENDNSIKDLIKTQDDLTKTIVDTKKEMAQGIIDAIKQAYEAQKELAIKALEDEMDAEERRHNRKMDNLDAEIKKLQRSHETDDYNKNLTKAQQEALAIQKKIDALALDNSIEAKAKREELLKELSEKQDEIAEMQSDRDLELREQNLEDEKEAEDKKFEQTSQRIEDEIEAEEYKFNELLKDEATFAQMKEDIIAGNLDNIKGKLQEFLDGFKSYNAQTVAEIGASWSALVSAISAVEDAQTTTGYFEKPTVYVRSGQFGQTDTNILKAQYGNAINIGIDDAKAQAFIGKDRYATMELYANFLKKYGIFPDTSVDISKIYKTGGLATKTGLAWLDGTLSKPERVLSAEQTESFDKLIRILPSVLRYLNEFNLKGNISDNLIFKNFEKIFDKYNSLLENKNITDKIIDNKLNRFMSNQKNIENLPKISDDLKNNNETINIAPIESNYFDKLYKENKNYLEDLLKNYIDINQTGNILGNINPMDLSNSNINLKNVGNTIEVNNSINFAINGNSDLTTQQLDKIANYINTKTVNGLRKKGLL